jgi:hypothetical protein
MLPPVRISQSNRTLEYDHIALVSSTDAALVEVSHNNGVAFQPAAQYTFTSRAGSWGTMLVNSEPVHELTYLQHLMDSAVIVRFRLISSVGGMDGWFIDNINFTDVAGVAQIDVRRSSLYPNPLRVNALANLSLDLEQPGNVKVAVVDLLGRTLSSREFSASSGKIELPIMLSQPGSYTVMIEYGSTSDRLIMRHKLIVMP